MDLKLSGSSFHSMKTIIALSLLCLSCLAFTQDAPAFRRDHPVRFSTPKEAGQAQQTATTQYLAISSLYVIGGKSGFEKLNAVAMYHVKTFANDLRTGTSINAVAFAGGSSTGAVEGLCLQGQWSPPNYPGIALNASAGYGSQQSHGATAYSPVVGFGISIRL